MTKNRPAPQGSRNWIDLLPVRDDKTVLRNLHKGWYWHYIDNGCGRPAYRDPAVHAPGDYVRDFPGLNHLYLRIDWCDIEAGKGVFDWSYIDAIMGEWGAQDYRFSFRVCCHEGGVNIPYAAPRRLRDWLHEKLGALRGEAEDEGAAVPLKLPVEKPLFFVPRNLIKSFNLDLAAAGIEKEDERGRTVDLHALRHTFGTRLSKNGVPPRTAQAAMRHSSLDLTMNVYTSPTLLGAAGAVNALPEFSPEAEQREEMVAETAGRGA